MACLLQPECNFLHGFFRCKLPVEAMDVEVKITSMQGTHIFRRDWTTQLIKCTPWSTRLCPHPTIIKKMKTFLEVEEKMGPVPTSQFKPPLPDTNPNIRKDNTAEEREQHPRSSGQQLPSLPQHVHPYQRPHLNPTMMYQINPYLQFQFVRALHGLAQAKCQATYLKIETGCSHQTIWTIAT